LWFVVGDCRGDAYADPDRKWKAVQGYVFREGTTVVLPPRSVTTYYIPRASVSTESFVSSFLNHGGGCISDPRTIEAFAAFPNDEVVTGVPNVGYPVPIVFSVPLPEEVPAQ
jgi:hypothetical protein